MFLRQTRDALTHRPNVVGIIDSPRALAIAQTLDPDDVDILELRVDLFAAMPDKLLKGISELSHPLLLTVRHPQEGGANSLNASTRRELFSRFLPHASLVDIELRSLESLSDIISKARAEDVKLVYSFHNFQSTPSHARLYELARRALLAEADV
jgi:3-dehydroquinate dehydratase-1